MFFYPPPFTTKQPLASVWLTNGQRPIEHSAVLCLFACYILAIRFVILLAIGILISKSRTIMSDESSNQKPADPSPSTSTGKLPSPSLENVPSVPKLQIPESVIPHMESGLLKSAVGATFGGIFGLVFFRGGKGWRMASVGAGVGVALGSTVERYMANPDKPPRSLFKVEGLF